MTPINLKPPPSPFQLAAEQKDEQHLQLYYLYSSHLPPSSSSSLSYPTFLNSSSPTQDQKMIKLQDSQLLDQKVDRYCIAHGGSSDDLQMFPSSSIQPTMNNNKAKREVGEGSTSDNESSAKWMSSKMRLMQKMMNSNSTGADESAKITQKLQYQMHDNNEVNSFNNSNNTIRVCADCNTTTTPLWRSGPRGPKSLCNACGIRQRKARRAMEAATAAAAGNGTINASTDSPSTKIKLHTKENKWRTNHVAQYKKQCKSPDPPPPPYQSQRKLCFKEFALNLSKNSALKQVFPQDVEEAAILLMELSCGFIHS